MSGYVQLIFFLVFLMTFPQNGISQDLDNKMTSKIIRIFLESFVRMDLNLLTPEMFVPVHSETLSLQFLTEDTEGLLWMIKGTNGQKMHLSLKDGSLLFTHDDNLRPPLQTIISHPDSRVLNDSQWHSFRVNRDGRTLKFYLDETYVNEMTTRSEVQFVSRGEFFLGGMHQISTETSGVVTTNFDGAFTDIEAKKSRNAYTMFLLDFLMFAELADHSGDVKIFDRDDWNNEHGTTRAQPTRPPTPPPTPPPERPTPVTFTSGSSVLYLRDSIDMGSGGSLSFRFRTLEHRGLLVLAKERNQNPTFFAMEIFDGILYFVYDLGSLTSRKMFTDRRVDDGEWHDVMMRSEGNQIVLSIDGRRFSVPVSRQNAANMYINRIFIGGYDDFSRAPWPLYTRQGYRGCLESLKVNNIGLDLHTLINNKNLSSVEIGCKSVAKVCHTQPCVNGYCTDTMDGYVCDCSNTPYTGKNCDEDAIIVGWDGTFSSDFTFLNREVTHTNDISFRFLTLLRDTILFRTETANTDEFIQAELEDGKVKVTFKADRYTKAFITGNNLNDYFWHTLFIRRRADEVEIWIDDKSHMVGVFGGEDFKLCIDKFRFGAIGEKGELKPNDYIGYMQNFIYDKQELFSLLKKQNSQSKLFVDTPYDELPLLTYKPVTLTTSAIYIDLPTLHTGTSRSLKTMFKFKTNESNGLIMYNKGAVNDAIAVELSNGQVRLAYNLGGRNKFTVAPTLMLNDNMWHTVTVLLNEGQFSLRVDSASINVSTSDSGRRFDLGRSLYIGGMPVEMFNRSEVDNLIESTKGYRGCLASMVLNGQVPNLQKFALDKQAVLIGCTVFDTSFPQNGNSQGVDTDTKIVDSTSKIIRFFGNSFLRHDLDVLPAHILAPVNTERLSLKFITQDSEGLLWMFKGSNCQMMHLSLKDGTLIFTFDDSLRSLQQMNIRQPDSGVLNDFQWHSVRVNKEGRKLKFYLDDTYVNKMTTRSEVQFVSRGNVFLGGTRQPSTETGGVVTENFDGAITDVESMKISPEREFVINYLKNVEGADHLGNFQLIDPATWNNGSYNWQTTRAPPTRPPVVKTQLSSRPPPVTFTTGSSIFYLRDTLDLRGGGSLSFRFRTLEHRCLLVLAKGSNHDPTFFAMEIFDGILYFVYDLGSLTSRKMFTYHRVDDSEWHDVVMRADGNLIVLSIDGRQLSFLVSRQNVANMYFYRLFVGGYDDFSRAPWPLYTRQGYRGCLESLKVNSIGLDLHTFVNNQNLRGVEIGCRSSARYCQMQPCDNGYCRDTMDGFVCDCSNTPYTGKNCNDDAIIAGWDGTFSSDFTFLNREVTHTNDISFRFLTLLRDTILFRTETANIDDFIQAELEDGKVKITFKADRYTKAFVTGNNLNDYFWHTLFIRRRADEVEVWIDDKSHMVGVIDGEDFKLYIDKIRFGAIGEKAELKPNDYIGYMQNFIYDKQDLFSLLRKQNPQSKWIVNTPYDELPLLTYKPVTLTTSDTYIKSPTLYTGTGRSLKTMFKFKTNESNGLIMYNKGVGTHVIAIELSNGQVQLAYNLGGRNKFTVAPTRMLNDNMWHTVNVLLNEGQFSLRVDSASINVSTSDGDGRLNLSGSLYIGGMPAEMFNRSEVDNLIESKKGYRGCLASMVLNGQVPNLQKFALDKQAVLIGCTVFDTSFPQNGNSQGVDIDTRIVDSTSKIIRFFGNSFLRHDFDVLPAHILAPVKTEKLSLKFITQDSEGLLLMFKGSNGKKMHLGLKDGTLIFTYDDSPRSSQQMNIRHPDSRVLNDFRWHSVRVDKEGRKLKFYLDDTYVNEMTTRSEVQFVSRGEVFIGGTRQSSTETGGVVIKNFNGAITDVESMKRSPEREFVISYLQNVEGADHSGDFQIIDLDTWNNGTYNWQTTRAPPTRPPGVKT